MKNPITVRTNVNASIDRVWEYWNGVDHIQGWAFASDDWGARGVTNDLQDGGEFKSELFAKDGSMSFDFEGKYILVKPNEHISYILTDGRKVAIDFSETPDGVEIVEMFEPEEMNSHEMQQEGWQAFLNNFKSYAERQTS